MYRNAVPHRNDVKISCVNLLSCIRNVLREEIYFMYYIVASCCTVLFNKFWGYVAVCVQLCCRWFAVLRLVVAVLHYMFRPTWPSSGVYDVSIFIFLKESASLLLLPLLHVRPAPKLTTNKTYKFRGLSPWVSYTDQATGVCLQS
jgi:hypothetical protein